MSTVSVSTLQATIARALGRFPRERARIERAATMITLGHISQMSPEAFEVKSQTDAETVYTIGNGGCPCIDGQRHPGQPYKHQWAVDITLVAAERQRRLDARELLSAAELARLAAWKRRHAVAA